MLRTPTHHTTDRRQQHTHTHSIFRITHKTLVMYTHALGVQPFADLPKKAFLSLRRFRSGGESCAARTHALLSRPSLLLPPPHASGYCCAPMVRPVVGCSEDVGSPRKFQGVVPPLLPRILPAFPCPVPPLKCHIFQLNPFPPSPPPLAPNDSPSPYYHGQRNGLYQAWLCRYATSATGTNAQRMHRPPALLSPPSGNPEPSFVIPSCIAIDDSVGSASTGSVATKKGP